MYKSSKFDWPPIQPIQTKTSNLSHLQPNPSNCQKKVILKYYKSITIWQIWKSKKITFSFTARNDQAKHYLHMQVPKSAEQSTWNIMIANFTILCHFALHQTANLHQFRNCEIVRHWHKNMNKQPQMSHKYYYFVEFNFCTYNCKTYKNITFCTHKIQKNRS
jgi:hypothetical protein